MYNSLRDGIQLPNTVMHVAWTQLLNANDKVAIELQEGAFYTDPRTFLHFGGKLLY